METFYTVQYSEKLKRAKVVKRFLQEGENTIEPDENYNVLSWETKRIRAIAIKDFINSYIRTQNEDIFNWKASYHKISNLHDMLDYFIQTYKLHE